MVYDGKPWLKSYDSDVPENIEIPAISLKRYYVETFKQHQDRAAYQYLGSSLTFGELLERSGRLAKALNEHGLGKGDVVSICLPNTPQYMICIVGALQAGCAISGLAPLLMPDEIVYQLKDCEAKALIILDMLFDAKFATVAGQVPDLELVLVTGIMDMLPRTTEYSAGKPLDGKKVAAFVDFFEQYPDEPPDVSFETGEACYLQYTGGTTGLSKGAMLTHGNLVANILQFQSVDAGMIEDGSEVVITAIPMYHIFALMVNTLSFFRRGEKNVLVTNPRDMESFVKIWAASRPSIFTGVNTLFVGLLHTPGFSDIDFSSLKFTMGGGAPVQKAVSQKWKDLTGSYIKEGYGLSETSPVATVNLLGVPEYRAGIGVPVPSTDISLRDDDGNEVPQGEPGELCIKGPQVTSGYWRQPEATAASMTDDGYFKTGDIAVMDEDGYFQIVDRKKDMILVSGFNVYPNEIEDVVAHMPGVIESACVGMPSEATGEAVKLFVVKSDDSITGENVRDFCREHLAGYKVPKQVVFLDELPKSAVGKILRRELK